MKYEIAENKEEDAGSEEHKIEEVGERNWREWEKVSAKPEESSLSHDV